jgi:hypothetical protein
VGLFYVTPCGLTSQRPCPTESLPLRHLPEAGKRSDVYPVTGGEFLVRDRSKVRSNPSEFVSRTAAARCCMLLYLDGTLINSTAAC